MLVSLDTSPEANAWKSGPGRTILSIFIFQIAVNQASHRLSTGRPVMENLVSLGAFALAAGICLWRRLRGVQAVWAEALLAPKGAKIG
jgi:hypothetical protein